MRIHPVWTGALRQRQALAAAEACARLLRLNADASALRDAHHLTRPADDPGSAGRLHRMWRDFAAKPLRMDKAFIARLAEGLDMDIAGVAFDELAAAAMAAASGSSPVEAAAAMAVKVVALVGPRDHARAEILAWAISDAVLAEKLGWRTAIPLMAIAAKTCHDGRRIRPGDPGWVLACHRLFAAAAMDAAGRAVDLQRRARKLAQAVEGLRSQGNEAALAELVSDDSVSATSVTGLGSERAARRFLERLHGLGVLREFSGRKTFRLYGM